MALIVDTETTDKVDFRKTYEDPCQPDLVQLGMILVDTCNWKKRMQMSLLIQETCDSKISSKAQEVHGITNDHCRAFGVPAATAAQLLQQAYAKADCIVAHNLQFDRTVLQTFLHRSLLAQQQKQQTHAQGFLERIPQICTMRESTDILQLPHPKFKKSKTYKWPSLQEAHAHFTGSNQEESQIHGAHDALVDAQACLTVFQALLEDSKVIQIDKRDNKQSMENHLHDNNDNPGTEEEQEEVVLAQPGELQIIPDGSQFLVRGNTYKYRESLKSLGGTWHPEQRAWLFQCLSKLGPVQKLAAIQDNQATFWSEPFS